MTTIRGTNSTIQASPISQIINKTTNLISIFSNSSYKPNMTTEEMNLALIDTNTNYIPDISVKQLNNYASYIIPAMLVVLIIVGFINHIQIGHIKNKIHIPNWIKTVYDDYTVKQVLPLYKKKKAKESPFIGAQPTPLVLPSCPRLENAEKGQNLKFQFSIPYRRFQSTENLTNEEHKITITTVVQKSPQMTSQ